MVGICMSYGIDGSTIKCVVVKTCPLSKVSVSPRLHSSTSL